MESARRVSEEDKRDMLLECDVIASCLIYIDVLWLWFHYCMLQWYVVMRHGCEQAD